MIDFPSIIKIVALFFQKIVRQKNFVINFEKFLSDSVSFIVFVNFYSLSYIMFNFNVKVTFFIYLFLILQLLKMEVVKLLLLRQKEDRVMQ